LNKIAYEAVRKFFVSASGKIVDFTIKSCGPPGESLPDATYADDPDFFAKDAGGERERGPGPRALSQIFIGQSHLSGRRKEQGHAKVGDISCENIGRVGNKDVFGSGEIQIDGVCADAPSVPPMRQHRHASHWPGSVRDVH
jgi:hypothetical protein